MPSLTTDKKDNLIYETDEHLRIEQDERQEGKDCGERV